VQLRPVICI